MTRLNFASACHLFAALVIGGLGCSGKATRGSRDANATDTDVLTWKLPARGGGSNELCREAACLAWLRDSAGGRVAIADLDGDGEPEVARADNLLERIDANHTDVTIYVARGGRYVAKWTVAGVKGEYLGWTLASAGDLDGDGRVELLAVAAKGPPDTNAKRPPPPPPPQLVVIEVEAGAALRRDVATLTDRTPGIWMVTADVDGDGAREVVTDGISQGEHSLEIRRVVAGTIADAPTWTYAIPAGGRQFVDDDGDGDADLWWSDASHSPGKLMRWPGGKAGLDAKAEVVRRDPSAKSQSWFGNAILAAPFTRAGSVEIVVTAHGARRAYVYQPGKVEPDRMLEPPDWSSAYPVAIDLEGDGVSDLAFYNETSVIVFRNARSDRPPVRWGP